jgi:sec-independent protein translocase protein TatA
LNKWSDLRDERMSLIGSILNIFEGPQGIFILLLILLLFGAKKLPELARGMGQALKEFQKAKNDFTDELHKATATEPEKQAEVKPAQSTVPRIENAPPPAGARPDPHQTVTPGDKADQV